MLQGAIASGRSERTSNDNRLSQLNEIALDQFHQALSVAGKENDLDALELKGLLLRQLGEIDQNSSAAAPHTFRQLQAAATARLGTLDTGAIDERRELRLVISRAARYQAEMLHADTPSTAIGLGILTALEQDLINGDRVAGHDLLERARFFEVNACIRIALNIAAQRGDGPEALQRIAAAERDYAALREQCDPRSWDWPTRVWGSGARLFREDGTKRLLSEAIAGLGRVSNIRQRQGCPVCKPSTTQKIVPTKTGVSDAG